MGRQPKEGSRAWEAGLPHSPEYARSTILDLVKRAQAGSPEAADALWGWLARHPDLRPLVRQLDGLAARAEGAWVERVCGADEAARRATREEVAALKAEFLGPAPSAADKILAAAVVVAHLAHHRAALDASRPADSPEVRAARDRLLSVAQRRLADALRAWDRHAAAKRQRPRGTVVLFEPGQDAA